MDLRGVKWILRMYKRYSNSNYKINLYHFKFDKINVDVEYGEINFYLDDETYDLLFNYNKKHDFSPYFKKEVV